jgi:hypothetical protein
MIQLVLVFAFLSLFFSHLLKISERMTFVFFYFVSFSFFLRQFVRFLDEKANQPKSAGGAKEMWVAKTAMADGGFDRELPTKHQNCITYTHTLSLSLIHLFTHV